MNRVVCPRYVTALFEHVVSEIGRVYGNRFQEEWDHYTTPDPKIPGMIIRPYNWNDHEEDEPANFEFLGVRIWWRRYPERAEWSDKDFTPTQWVEWFDQCVSEISKCDPYP